MKRSLSKKTMKIEVKHSLDESFIELLKKHLDELRKETKEIEARRKHLPRDYFYRTVTE